MQSCEREIYTLSIRKPQSHNTNPLKESREKESGRRQNGNDQFKLMKKNWTCSKDPPILKNKTQKWLARSFHRDNEMGKSCGILRGYI